VNTGSALPPQCRIDKGLGSDLAHRPVAKALQASGDAQFEPQSDSRSRRPSSMSHWPVSPIPPNGLKS